MAVRCLMGLFCIMGSVYWIAAAVIESGLHNNPQSYFEWMWACFFVAGCYAWLALTWQQEHRE